jgi:hypothetical protein
LVYLIDANIAIHARDVSAAVLAKRAEHDGEVLLSALSLAELQRGVYHRDTTGPVGGFVARCRLMPQPPTAGSLLNSAGHERAIMIQ